MQMKIRMLSIHAISVTKTCRDSLSDVLSETVAMVSPSAALRSSAVRN